MCFVAENKRTHAACCQGPPAQPQADSRVPTHCSGAARQLLASCSDVWLADYSVPRPGRRTEHSDPDLSRPRLPAPLLRPQARPWCWAARSEPWPGYNCQSVQIPQAGGFWDGGDCWRGSRDGPFPEPALQRPPGVAVSKRLFLGEQTEEAPRKKSGSGPWISHISSSPLRSKRPAQVSLGDGPVHIPAALLTEAGSLQCRGSPIFWRKHMGHPPGSRHGGFVRTASSPGLRLRWLLNMCTRPV